MSSYRPADLKTFFRAKTLEDFVNQSTGTIKRWRDDFAPRPLFPRLTVVTPDIVCIEVWLDGYPEDQGPPPTEADIPGHFGRETRIRLNPDLSSDPNTGSY